MISFSRLITDQPRPRGDLVRYSLPEGPIIFWEPARRFPGASPGELTLNEAKAMIAGLPELRVPMLVLEEPLGRPDWVELAGYATGLGLNVILSADHRRFTPEIAAAVKTAGIHYAGLNVYSLPDPVAGPDAAGQDEEIEQILSSSRCLAAAGLRYGIKLCFLSSQLQALARMLDRLKAAGVTRIALYQRFSPAKDAGAYWAGVKEGRRALVELLAGRAGDPELELVTEDHYADGIFILSRLARSDPERAKQAASLLRKQGGCAAGRKLLFVGPDGRVSPCPSWRRVSLGNVRQVSLEEVWKSGDGLVARLRERSTLLSGRCGNCPQEPLCGGCRSRAHRALKDPWGEDPACYLEDGEIAYGPS